MANIRITPQQLSAAGIVPTDVNCVAGNTYLVSNDGRVFIDATAGGASANITINTLTSVGGFAVADAVVALTAAQEKVLGPFSKRTYHPNGADLQFSVSAPVTVRVYRL